MALSDTKTVANLFERHRGGSFQLIGDHARTPELCRKRHRKTPGVRRSEQLFRVSAHTVFKSRAERILRLLQDAALCRERPSPALKISLPNPASLSLHNCL